MYTCNRNLFVNIVQHFHQNFQVYDKNGGTMIRVSVSSARYASADFEKIT